MEQKVKSLILSQVSKVELVYRSKAKASARLRIKDSSDSHQILREIWDDETICMVEEFKILFLNQANRVIGFLEVSRGGVTGAVADPKIYFSVCLADACL